MGRELSRLKRRKSILQKLHSFSNNLANVLIIHYSCENFYNTADGRSPRITSIAVRNALSCRTDSFSIHQYAEVKGIDFDNIVDHYDDLEHEMLKGFYEFVKTHINFCWIHWNMRDSNFGFPAIEHRFRVLGGKPETITEERNIDLSPALINIYGDNYIEHPRLPKLIEKNNITSKDILSGEQEAIAFEDREFVKLHQSTLRKVDALSTIFLYTIDKNLQTNSSWRKANGFNFPVLIELLKEHWLLSLLPVIVALLTIFNRIFDLYDKISKWFE